MRILLLIFIPLGGLVLTACSEQAANPSETKSAEASACTASEDDSIIIANAWVNAADATRPTTAIYLTLCNGTATDDALTGASFAGADAVEVHESTEDESGLAGMAPVASLALPAGEEVKLEHGGAHIMLIGLNEDIVAGSEQKLTLTFENAEPLEVSLKAKDQMGHSEH